MVRECRLAVAGLEDGVCERSEDQEQRLCVVIGQYR